MKKLICFLLLIPLFAFSQTNDIDVTIVKEKSTIGKVKDVAITTASVMSATTLFKVAKNAASQVYLDRSEAILVPLNVELSDYTTLALVDCFMGTKRKAKYFNLMIESQIPQWNSRLKIINPANDEIKFKENSFYLENEKHKDWLYMYFTRVATNSSLKNFNTIIILRDYNGKIVFESSTIDSQLNNYDGSYSQIFSFLSEN
tara:strand:+ start:2389 stop:2994 length:606 start_codon:yes stop_codon:yes gene_type:complete